MTTSDRSGNPEKEEGSEAPRFAFHDRRRIDPQTGEVRVPDPAETTDKQPTAPEETEAVVVDEVDDAEEQPVFPTAEDVADLPIPPDSEPVPSVVDAEQATEPTKPASDPVQAEWEDLTRQLADRTADLKRINAEYANYRKRVDRDREAVAVAGKSQLAAELLVVLDDLGRAEAHGDLTGAFKSVADKLVDALTKAGLQAYGEENEPFNPAEHEAVAHDTSSDVSGPTVTAVLRRGYRFGDRVLRPALVAVTDFEAGAPASDNGSGAAAEQDEKPAESAADAAEPTDKQD
ncbi:nucleotide exchange factor GrpE [Actinoalloteichus hymeniacidonis]|uniref:Protein GrpE n=1 Tax=Actinoalloteichus hymeniacidonis TaxID=340345 RepID=A0AAC9HVD1_9PSEU|nr:nucleotide exchange factor GrpE [Actinoalloteichus hymeniacidonis]AOS66054.1 molecular chaperone GrpE (heat shock protein) [Actinoalloteichus hymeniacidonis]MBB5905843.1 molecular chaperone GrpE [Actinoalloteichus hymeniacidonis]